MLRLLIGAAIALTSTIAYAQQDSSFNALELQPGETITLETADGVEEELPVMTSFPTAVMPTIQFGNQCPHECNPCNYSLWDNYCAEKKLWCQKQHHCGCKDRCGHGVCSPCNRGCGCKMGCGCNSGCGEMPCAEASQYVLPDTVNANLGGQNAVASKPDNAKTASRPRPANAALPFWTDPNTGVSIER